MARQDMRDRLTSDLQRAAILAKKISEMQILAGYFENPQPGPTAIYSADTASHLKLAVESAQAAYDGCMQSIGRQLVEVTKAEGR